MPYSTLTLFLPIAVFCASTCAAQDVAPATGSGMVVARDTESGQLRTATAAEMRALQHDQQQQQMQRSSARVLPSQPALVVGPGGRRSVRLGESHLVYAVASRDGEGKLVEQCVDGAHAAEQLVAQPAAATRHQGHAHARR